MYRCTGPGVHFLAAMAVLPCRGFNGICPAPVISCVQLGGVAGLSYARKDLAGQVQLIPKIGHV
jgi:hypothetical protein